MSTPDLHLRTLFVLDERGRIVRTREPDPSKGSLFSLTRSATAAAWAVHASVPDDIAADLALIARDEPPARDFAAPPVHADRYSALIARVRTDKPVHLIIGPAFSFPDHIEPVADVDEIRDEALLNHHFTGWIPGEIAAGRAPVMAVIEDGYPVSTCCCARLTETTAEAGLETAEPYRRRGYAVRVTAAWALAIRASGRAPFYGTQSTNEGSLAVARKLGLIQYAVDWRLSE